MFILWTTCIRNLFIVSVFDDENGNIKISQENSERTWWQSAHTNSMHKKKSKQNSIQEIDTCKVEER